jgi:uncharacterized protein (TIGR02231 family)
MKHINLSILVILFSSISSLAQISVQSEVKEATLFSNQAQISREQSVRLNKGLNEVKFLGLENSILNNTIQVSGSNGVTIISSDIQSENTLKSQQSSKVIRLLDSLDVIQKTENLVYKQIKNLEFEKNAILSNTSANGVNSGFNLDNMLDLAEYYRNNLNKLDEMMYNKNTEIEKLRDTKNELNLRLKELGYSNRNIVMNLEVISDKPQLVTLKLVYVVNNIGWTPFYEIKTNGIGSNVKAICKAKIHQNSSVEWKNVIMKLSTTSPSNIGTLPTVHPWILRFQSDGRSFNSKVKNQLSYQNGSQSNRSYDQAAEIINYDSKSLSTYTVATNNMVSREFAILLPYTISGNNGKTVVELEKFEMPADYLYYSAPKYNCNVFLIANITEWEKYNFLPGPANLFLEGTYVGNTFINPNATEDTMSLVLGIDKNIIIEREKIKDFSRNALLGGKKKVDMGIQITVKNKKSLDIDLMLEDQVPISSENEIEIEIKDVSGAKKEDATGKLTWNSKLKPGEQNVFKIKYEVKYPKGKPLSNF